MSKRSMSFLLLAASLAAGCEARESSHDDVQGALNGSPREGRQGPPGERGPRGSDGPRGRRGPKGDDALQPLSAISDLPRGSTCAYGGQRIDTGLDTDEDGVLDAGEISDTAQVCHGAPGGSAPGGFRLIAKFVTAGGPIAEIVAATPDGRTLAYTSSAAQSVGFADITVPERPTSLGAVDIGAAVASGNGEATSVAITPNGQYALAAVKDTTDPVANADPGALVFIDMATRAIAGSIPIGVGPDSLHITPDGKKAVIAIEDEENGDENGAAQARPGSVQVVTLDYDSPTSSSVATIALAPDVGNLASDPQPEFVDITPDGSTAIVSLQENNVLAIIDLHSETVTRYIDAGTSVHARADLSSDGEVDFSDPGYVGLLEPDSVCLLSDGYHFLTANEGDTPNENFGAGLFAGGRGFSVFNLAGERVYDSGDAAEWYALRRGAYTEGRSADRGIEFEGCASGVFHGVDYAFLLGERNATVTVVDMSIPAEPAIRQLLGAPMRPEGAVALSARNLLVVSGEGDDGTGGGLWIYEAVTDPGDAGHGPDVYDAHSTGTPFSALGALAYEPSTGFLLATPDNAFLGQRIWSFFIDHGARRMELVRELSLQDKDGAPLTGYDPEGLVVNPEGGYILASEGIAGNGGSATCLGSALSNRLLFVDVYGRLDPAYGADGVVDLPCGSEPKALDWTTVRGNGFEGVTVIDSAPDTAGGLKVYAAMQRALTTEGQNTRIGEYDVDTGVWSFYFYPLDPNPGGARGNTFLSELIHVGGDTFAVLERDQGWAGEAANKTLRTFSLSSGTADDISNPLEKTLAYDLLSHPFRFDQEKIEGLALGGGALWVTNDNDGGEAANFFLKLNPAVLGRPGAIGTDPGTPPGRDAVVINEVRSQGDDFVELHNRGSSAIDLSGWKLTDSDPTHVYTLPAGTILAPGAHLLIDAEGSGAALALSFGLGAADSAILATPPDVVVSEYSWTAHVASASRCPNGIGNAFWSPTPATPGAPNDCTPPAVPGQDVIVINEVNSQGSDFVELYNPGPSEVSLAGWKITDNDETHVYELPPGTVIAGGAVLLVEGENSSAPLHLSFGLGSGDSARLYTPFDALVDQHTWTAHVASASRCPHGSGAFVAPTTATPGAPNACP